MKKILILIITGLISNDIFSTKNYVSSQSIEILSTTDYDTTIKNNKDRRLEELTLRMIARRYLAIKDLSKRFNKIHDAVTNILFLETVRISATDKELEKKLQQLTSDRNELMERLELIKKECNSSPGEILKEIEELKFDLKSFIEKNQDCLSTNTAKLLTNQETMLETLDAISDRFLRMSKPNYSYFF